MGIDEDVEEAARVCRFAEIPRALAELLTIELRTCRRVLREIKRLAVDESTADVPLIHALAVAALEVPV